MAAQLWLEDCEDERQGDDDDNEWGHHQLREDMAIRVVVAQFGSLAEAKRVHLTLSKRARDERPELAEFMRSIE